MKIIVTHKASDLDAVASSWMIKRFLPGWENAEIRFVPAGEKLAGKYIKKGEIIERIELGDDDVADIIHVDTGMDSLDHHQIASDNVCSTSLAFDYALKNNEALQKNENKVEALKRIVNYAVDDDHFQEVFWVNPMADVYDFSIVGLIQGIKLLYPKDDTSVMNFGMDSLDAAFHFFENRVHAEREIKDKGIRFDTKWGKGLAIETQNDTVLKLGQMMGNVITVRKDPDTGNVRIKARPAKRKNTDDEPIVASESFESIDVDFTPVYERLKKMDPEASWFLHISKRMLLNGSSKNPTMKGSKLTLDEVVEVLQNV